MSHSGAEGASELAEAGRRFFQAAQSGDPLNATLLGVEGFDDQLGDPSRAGTDSTVRELRAVHEAVTALADVPLADEQRTERDVLRWLVEGSLADVEHSLWEGNASAAGYVSPQSLIFQAIPAAPMAVPGAVEAWLTRLRDLPAFVDAIGTRYRIAAADGRPPTAVGVAQARTQLDQHLGRPIDEDVLVTLPLPPATTRPGRRQPTWSRTRCGRRCGGWRACWTSCARPPATTTTSGSARSTVVRRGTAQPCGGTRRPS